MVSKNGGGELQVTGRVLVRKRGPGGRKIMGLKDSVEVDGYGADIAAQAAAKTAEMLRQMRCGDSRLPDSTAPLP